MSCRWTDVSRAMPVCWVVACVVAAVTKTTAARATVATLFIRGHGASDPQRPPRAARRRARRVPDPSRALMPRRRLVRAAGDGVRRLAVVHLVAGHLRARQRHGAAVVED